MKEVAAKAMHLWFRPLAVKGIPIERLVAGTDVSIDMLRSRKARFSWAELCVMLGNVTPSFTEEELVEIGRSYIRSQPMRFAFVIGRVLLTPACSWPAASGPSPRSGCRR